MSQKKPPSGGFLIEEYRKGGKVTVIPKGD